jgi:AraC family transcriptional regulator, regulatory protein of adaptative response / methylated-DNA-[protein]-cysteine methyltransferase
MMASEQAQAAALMRAPTRQPARPEPSARREQPESEQPERRVTDEAAWAAVMARDARYDGQFVLGVETTGVYCRPSCPARHPLRENVSFFQSTEEAEHAGFRPCLRCKPREAKAPWLATVDRARGYIDAHLDEPVSLSRLSRHVGQSSFHLQRTFKRIVGLTPKQYQRLRRAERFKSELKRGTTVTDAIYEAGYGSTSRLYSVSNAQLGMTPSAFRRGGEGMQIRYATKATPFGRLLVAATDRGLCSVMLGDKDAELEDTLAEDYPLATRERAPQEMDRWIDSVLASIDGKPLPAEVPVDALGATEFKWRVWRALIEIPYGETRTYTQVAESIGAPNAVRAVARACATNKAALLIPCHRVVGTDGKLHGYRWGLERKRQLLAHERERAGEGAAPARTGTTRKPSRT